MSVETNSEQVGLDSFGTDDVEMESDQYPEASTRNEGVDWVEKYVEVVPDPHRDAEVLRELYWGRGLSTREVADRLDTHQYAVWSWMKRCGIPRREPG